MLFSFILTFLPIIFLFIFSLLTEKKWNVTRIPFKWCVLFLLILIFTIAFYPAEMSSDKPRYSSMYYNVLLLGDNYEFRDPGWIFYNRVCGVLFGNSIELFYLLTAAVYVGGSFIVGVSLFPKNYVAYLLVMAAGCLGFSNYGTNVIRAGFALSLIIIAYSINCKALYKILLVIVALSIQKSVIIPIFAFLGARFLKPIWISGILWFLCLLLSAANFDLSVLFETFGFVDERVEQYAETINTMGGSSYEKGFRWDFLIYSLAPILFAFYYIYKKKIVDFFYANLIKIYLIANAVWLLAIRMAYSDRLAYLSWFLIPLVALYPVIKYPQKFLRPQRILIFAMFVFMGVRIALSLRNNIL